MTEHGSTARKTDPWDELRQHLRTHLDSECADFLLWNIGEWVSEIKPRKKGDSAPHFLDSEIDELWDEINACHTGGKQLGKAYWPKFYATIRLMELRDRTRTIARPRNEQRDLLINNLNEFYPPIIKRKSRGNHFQETVRMVCGLAGIQTHKANHKLERTIADATHSMVIRTLKYWEGFGVEVPPAYPTSRLEAAWNWWRTKVRSLQ